MNFVSLDCGFLSVGWGEAGEPLLCFNSMVGMYCAYRAVNHELDN